MSPLLVTEKGCWSYKEARIVFLKSVVLIITQYGYHCSPGQFLLLKSEVTIKVINKVINTLKSF